MAAFFLAFLELTFVMVALLILHRMKPTIGKGAFYIMVGMFFVFGQIISASGLQLYSPQPGFSVNVGHGILLAPFLATLLVVYVVDGTLEAQRLILGFLALLFGYYYLTSITVAQVFWQGYTAENKETVMNIIRFFYQGRETVTASFAVYGINLFTLPVIYQFFRNCRLRMFVCVLATLFFAQVIDVFVFELLISRGLGDWWAEMRSTYLARAVSTIWLSVLVGIYFYTSHSRDPLDVRRPLDIILAFLGGYRRAQLLQRHLREWEGRYRLVVEHSNDIISVVSQSGNILSINSAGTRILQMESHALHRFTLTELVYTPQNEKVEWASIWNTLKHEREREHAERDVPVIRREWLAYTPHGKPLNLEAQISAAELGGSLVAVIIARDITERRRMEEERQRLQEQLIHSQRLEALGHLAGGVAHDFNNMLHTMQGGIEVLERDRPNLSENARHSVENLVAAIDRASSLTSQLLGFARRGKYRMEKLNVGDLIEETRALFEPVAGRKVSFKTIPPPTTLFVEGDSTQLEQVLINLLVNARDAFQEESEEGGKIVLRADTAQETTPGWQYCPESARHPADYVCIRVKDNGPGIPEDIRSRIFEPFFTTKSVGKGTGMGLAMVYGCVASHDGWIHVESEPGEKTEFFVFLPIARFESE